MCLIANGQESTYLSDFNVQNQGDDVVISWTTSADFRCEDLKVEHGLDSNQFISVYTYPGICGLEGKEENYFFVFQKLVYNQINFFRINLGIYGFSEIKSTQIVKRTGLHPLVTPNPANSSSIIHFSNNDREPASIQLYSAGGLLIGSPVLSNKTEVQLSLFPELPSGFYFYSISVKGRLAYGRFFFN